VSDQLHSPAALLLGKISYGENHAEEHDTLYSKDYLGVKISGHVVPIG
jgi:hypothetical protein